MDFKWKSFVSLYAVCRTHDGVSNKKFYELFSGVVFDFDLIRSLENPVYVCKREDKE